MFDALFEMWRMVIDHFGIEACDKGDTLYWYWCANLDIVESS